MTYINSGAFTAFLTLFAAGGILSLLIEVVNRVLKAHAMAAKAVTLLLCVGLATVFVLFSGATWWPTVLAILSGASVAYAFIVKEIPTTPLA